MMIIFCKNHIPAHIHNMIAPELARVCIGVTQNGEDQPFIEDNPCAIIGVWVWHCVCACCACCACVGVWVWLCVCACVMVVCVCVCVCV